MQTKTKTYAISTTADNSPVYNLLPSDSICNENSRLTDTEKDEGDIVQDSEVCL